MICSRNLSKLKSMKIFQFTSIWHSLIVVLFLVVKRKLKNEFNFFIPFWRSVDENSSMTWSATSNKLSILYYFNSEDLDYLLSLLNAFARDARLDREGWKLHVKWT